RGDAIAKSDAVAVEPLPDPQRAGADLGIVGLMDRSLDRAGDDGAIAMIGRGMIDDAVAQKRPVLHEPEHGIPPGSLSVVVSCSCFVALQQAACPASPI